MYWVHTIIWPFSYRQTTSFNDFSIEAGILLRGNGTFFIHPVPKFSISWRVHPCTYWLSLSTDFHFLILLSASWPSWFAWNLQQAIQSQAYNQITLKQVYYCSALALALAVLSLHVLALAVLLLHVHWTVTARMCCSACAACSVACWSLNRHWGANTSKLCVNFV